MSRVTDLACCLFCYAVWSMCTVSTQTIEWNPDEDPPTIDACPSLPVKQLELDNWSYTDLGLQWSDNIRRAMEKKGKRRYGGLDEPWYLFNNGSFVHHPLTYRGLEQNDASPFYFQGACPYTAHWLTAFLMAGRFKDWCYLIDPWKQNARIVSCDQPYCVSRCGKRNSVCLEDHFRTHYVWAYCPSLRPRRACNRSPWRCMTQVALKLPQSCKCWSCVSKSKMEELRPK